MARKIKASQSCAIKDTSARLADVSSKLQTGELDFELAQEEINKIYNDWAQTPGSTDFGELIVKAHLSDYHFLYNSERDVVEKQCRIEALNLDNEELFRYRDTAKNKIESKFSHAVFEHLFVNRSKLFFGNPYITTKQDFNRGVVQFKNDLCAQIVSDLGIEELVGKKFFDRSGAVIEDGEFNYLKLMNHPSVGNFISRYLNKVLSDPITYNDKLHTVYSLLAINNFDTMLVKELKKLITLTPGLIGTINNNNYVQETANTYNDYWAADTHEDKDIRNYTSNMAKFIMRQIPKVIKQNGKYVQLNGQYLGPNDVYVMSALIKQAEYEYNLLYPDNEVILATNLVESFKTLIDHRNELPAFKNAKAELVDSFESFLWNGDDTNFSISQLFHENFPLNGKIIDIESLLDFEIYQSTAPTYTELSEDGVVSYTNHGGLYQGGAALKRNITEFLFRQLKSKRKQISKKYYNNGYPEQASVNSKIINIVLIEALGLDPQHIQIYQQFITDNLQDLNKLAKFLAETIYNLEEKSKAAYKALQEKNDTELYRQLGMLSDTLLSKNFLLSKEFRTDYIRLVSDKPTVQYTSNSGSVIPVYRLNSAITQIPWFLHQYKSTQVAQGQNFLVDNPVILSKYKDRTLTEWNNDYKNYISYLLGIGNEDVYTPFNELPPHDQLQVLMLVNINSLANGIFYTQPVCYSDKTSVGLVAANLAGQLTNGNTLASLINLQNPTESIANIRKIDYKYRKNQCFNQINSILRKWSQIQENLNYAIATDESIDAETKALFTVATDITPLTVEELEFSRNEPRKATVNKIRTQVENLKEYFNILNNTGLFQRAVSVADNNYIELIDEFDYSTINGKIVFNQSLELDFTELSSRKAFDEAQNLVMDRMLNSVEVKTMINSIINKLKESDVNSIYYLLLVQQENQEQLRQKYEDLGDKERVAAVRGPKYFTRKWDTEAKQYVFDLVQEEGKESTLYSELRLQSALSNLFRYAFIDLISKSYYLDPAKKSFAPEIERAKRIDAMSKRMVLYPATIQAFAQGKLDGVSQEAIIAVVKDPQEETWNLNGDIHDQDIYDGSGLESPFWSMMEDNSLPGHGIQGTKKTLGTSTRGHNSTLFKWAGFPITNEKMRNSTGCTYDLHEMFKKMHDDIYWGEQDITKGLFDRDLSIPGKLLNRDIFYSDGLNYYKIVSITHTKSINNYIIRRVRVHYNGVPFEDKVEEQSVYIDTIYKLWEALGGLNSVELQDGILQPSETSIDATFQYIINVGTVKDPNARHYNQSTVEQPLRDKFIAIVANKSAIKRGACNINSAKSAWESDDQLRTFTFNTSCFGVQLDANHHSDLADVREMSQTISTLAALGYTSDIAEEAYQSIGELVNLSLGKINKYLNTAERKSIEDAISDISRKLVQKLATETKIASTDAFVEMFTDELKVTLPISDRRFYKVFVKLILEDLNKSSIRRRYSGLGGILNPASNIMQIYDVNGKQYLFTTLLKEAKRVLSRDSEAHANLETYWEANPETRKDFDIVKYYLHTILGKTPEEAIASIKDDVTVPIAYSKINTIKPLDTIRYRLSESDDWEYLSLNTQENLLKFYELVNANTNTLSGTMLMQVELVISRPHDLRPQNITWTTLHPSGITSNGETIINAQANSIYATIGTRLARSVGKKRDINNQIDNIIASLAEDGIEIKQSCKL